MDVPWNSVYTDWGCCTVNFWASFILSAIGPLAWNAVGLVTLDKLTALRARCQYIATLSTHVLDDTDRYM